jgi:hypothetical protein
MAANAMRPFRPLRCQEFRAFFVVLFRRKNLKMRRVAARRVLALVVEMHLRGHFPIAEFIANAVGEL